ncbi:MAG: hypothetical protein BWZ10_01908 [candidate division BRC1 bacterium ADurb.BinA364]|nr:MAG: hypothetical protein BWZ10_01908 [candidate division BRC1 bacterium ADurb.BinA364]
MKTAKEIGQRLEFERIARGIVGLGFHADDEARSAAIRRGDGLDPDRAAAEAQQAIAVDVEDRIVEQTVGRSRGHLRHVALQRRPGATGEGALAHGGFEPRRKQALELAAAALGDDQPPHRTVANPEQERLAIAPRVP